jgi:large subunit ribosomal protein L4
MQASLFKPAVAGRALRPAAVARVGLVARASAVKSVAVPVKTVSSGSDAGSENLAIKVADESSARGLVHRYLVMVQQNARRVSAHSMPAELQPDQRGGAIGWDRVRRRWA